MKINESDLTSYFSNTQQTVTLVDAIDLVGSANKFQWRQLILLCLLMATIAICVSSGSYTYIPPPLLCDEKPCELINNYCSNNYKITVDRTDYDYNTIVTEFELWCDRKYLQRVAQSIYFLGSIFGGTIMSFLGDKYGRKPVYLASLGIVCIGVIGITFSISIEMYIATNFILGFGAMPPYLLNYIIINETSGKKFRQKASIGILIAWSLAEIATSGIFYIIKDWKQALLYFVTIPFCLLSVVAMFIIKETPSFYSTKYRHSDMIKTLDYIASVNNTTSFTNMLPFVEEKLDSQLRLSAPLTGIVNNTETYSLKDLFQYKSLRNASFGFMVVSFTLHLIFYGGQYSIDAIASGDAIYILGATMGISELFAYLAIRQFIGRIKRRRSIILSYIFSLLCCASFMFFGFSADATKFDCSMCARQIIVIILACLIRIFNSFGFAIQALFATEFYPTCVRSLGTGFLFAMGILGSFFSPYSIAISDAFELNPYIVIGVLSLGGPFATMLIKETLGQPLTDQIEEKQSYKFVNEDKQ